MTHAFPRMFLKPFKNSQHVFFRVKNPIKHSCLFFKHYIRLVIQIIYISWNRCIKRKIIIFNYTKFWFYIQIKHLIKDQCTDQAQKAKRVLSAVSLIFVISIYFFYLSMFHWVIIHWSLSTVQFRSCSCHNPTFMYVQSHSKFWVAGKLAIVIGSRGQILSWIEVWHVWNWQLFHCRWPNCWLQHILTWLIVCVMYVFFFLGVKQVKVPKKTSVITW